MITYFDAAEVRGYWRIWQGPFGRRLSYEVTTGTMSHAVTIFLLQAVLVPRTWDGVTSLKEYFLERRVWFYSFLAFATILDNVDSYLIGGFQYILDTGYIGTGISVATIPIVIIGMRTANILTHNIMATIFFGWQILIGFGHLETLRSAS